MEISQFLYCLGPKDCIKLSIPAVNGESMARLRWRMRFENLPDYTVDNIKPVALRQLETIHLIQTDKAWYTPGQLVRFRILSMNHILYPLLEPVCLHFINSFFNLACAHSFRITISRSRIYIFLHSG